MSAYTGGKKNYITDRCRCASIGILHEWACMSLDQDWVTGARKEIDRREYKETATRGIDPYLGFDDLLDIL